MLKFVVKRPREGSSATAEPAKHPRLEWGNRDPASVVVWNCNGLPVRLTKGNKPDILAFLSEHAPDLFCLGEVRAAAHCKTPGYKKGDGLPRVRGKAGEGTEAMRADKRCLDEFIEEIADNYCVYYSLADYKYAGTAVFVRKSAVCKPTRVRYNLDMEKDAKVHDTEGRVIFMEWDSISVLHVYAPNNGWQPKGFVRREAWDASVKSFLTNLPSETNVLWCGDLNIAPEDVDLSHPGAFKKQVQAKPLRPPAKYVGQPGCTAGERESFADIIETAGLVDLYRAKNPADVVADPSGPYFSWRGNRGASGGGKYSGRGMRIDHFLAPKAILDRVESCEIYGFGAEMTGFMGSDHSPMKLVLSSVEVKGNG